MNKVLSEIFPTGCSEKQRDEYVREAVKPYGNLFNWLKSSSEAAMIYKEMSALNLLESCYAYNGIESFYTENSWLEKGSYYAGYLSEYVELGGQKSELDNMLEIQTKYLTEKCKVVYAGCLEGVRYNAITECIWADE